MDNKTNFVFSAGICTYLCMPIVLSMTFEHRGYFAVGGEWFLPLWAMVFAYAFYVNKAKLANALFMAYVILWLGITARYRNAKKATKGVF